MGSDSYRSLAFDRELFGFEVVLLQSPSLGTTELLELLDELRARGVRLAYWPAAPEPRNDAAAERAGGFLADERTTYVCDLAGLGEIERPTEVEEYASNETTPELEELAIASAELSRFAVDPRVPRRVFETLYRRWLVNSLEKRLAEVTLVVRDGDRIVGMATVGEKDGRSDIGLIAVDAHCRGRSLGTKLVRAAQHWGRTQHRTLAQVVTQGRNEVAARLYARCRYRVERVEHYYHFWL
ncbi:MAG: GNAT family N-acetyltransferase [Planctomycetes bacterium]|nr:GNAT family N-acetyltransferase [Planctomycetota bacterium]